jgi:tRNA pseudouridine55 synthase
MEGEHIKIYKEKGETPLERLERLRTEHPKYMKAKLSYAGRLDPMAEGVMLILVGDENKKREKYLKYSKEYTFEILFGFKTDSFDLLGLPGKNYKDTYISERVLNNTLKEFEGEIVQKYPMYSSKTVKGKPLHQWAKEGKKVEIPEHKVNIFNIKLLKIKEISKSELRKYIIENVLKVKGDFRQKEILDAWDKLLNKTRADKFKIAEVNVFCGSGTYVRSLANDIGNKLKSGALAYSIKREDMRKPT